jgi:hypothetical protein
MRLTNRLMKDDKISLPKRLWLCLKAFEESGNPMKAGDALFQAAY